MAGYSSGDAKWYFTPQPVQSSTLYQFSDWYQGSVATEVDAAVTMSDGTVQYFWLGSVPASSSWAQFTKQFQTPAGATQITLFHLIAANGTLVTDDFSFTPIPVGPGGGFTRGLVSVTLDDGWTNQYTTAEPILSKYAVPATFYIISGELTDQPDYMSGAQVSALHTAGNEIGSHTVTHPHMTTLSATQLDNELKNSQITLQNLLGVPVPDFAIPFGEYNTTTITAGEKYYQTQRTVDRGLNTKTGFNANQLMAEEVDNTTTQAQVQAWINQAAADHSWLILIYHEVCTDADLITPSDMTYHTVPTDFDAEMAMVKASGLGVTVQQAMAEIGPQL
jgi:peptidoglycan/xylan/chitin deacetylase (PgdA/CDA1 family)